MHFLAVYLLGVLAMLVGSFVTFRLVVRRAYLSHGRITAVPLILELILCGLYYHFPYLYLPARWPNLPALPDGWTLRIPGLGLIGLGIIVMSAGMVSLGFRRLFGLASPAVHQRGLYGVCRNPQIVGGFLCTLGFAALWPSWYATGWVLLYGPVFHMMVLTEEEHLLQTHGDAYRRHCEIVPRYVDLWRSRIEAPL
jgi:protein-S-isoprenylcysteine O-methyltransferase Ste14